MDAERDRSGPAAPGSLASAEPGSPLLVEDAAALAAVVQRLRTADVVAVDVEANGMFVYRARLCTVQLAWRGPGDDRVSVAVVDALAADVAPLGPALGADGPVKIVHDLTFDARMLQEVGVVLGHVRDTSVAARLLGRTATGLAALLGAELGVAHDKRFQQHDWGRRPIGAAEVRYLVDDVAHLVALDEALARHVRDKEIEEEVAEECAYKLAAALAPPRDVRPAWVRVRGAAALDGPGRAALRRLVAARERLAAEVDVPPFKILGNDQLLTIARTRPGGDALRAILGRSTRHTSTWARALVEAAGDGEAPAEERALLDSPRPDRATAARRRSVEHALTAWRRAEAAARGVDEQAVMPGHCVNDLCDLALAAEAEAGRNEGVEAAVAAVPGLGAKRLARYGEALAAVVRRAATEPVAPSGAAPAGAPPEGTPP